MRNQDKWVETNTFHYHNQNPKNRITEDCVARAISAALEQDYNQTIIEMVQMQVKTGYALDGPKGIDKYLQSKGFIKYKQPRKDDNTKYTGEEWCNKISKDKSFLNKNIVANIGGHHTVCIKPREGKYKVWDIWNSTDGCIGNYWMKCSN